MIKMRTIALAMLIMVSTFLISCESPSARNARVQGMVDETAEMIPQFAQFYEENEEFFDLLLDIQERLRVHYLDVESEKFTVRFLLDSYHMSAEHSINGFNVIVSNDELNLIELALKELDALMQGYFLNATVRDDMVAVGFSKIRNRTFLRLVSPIEFADEWSRAVAHGYLEEFSEGWSFFIDTSFRH